MQHWMRYGITAGVWVMVGAISGTAALAQPTQCQYDPDSDSPNPLGMRAYLTLTETDGNTRLLYEQFPSNVNIDADTPATIESSRTLTFYGVGIDQARQILLNNPAYYSELLGYEEPDGFALINQVLTCR